MLKEKARKVDKMSPKTSKYRVPHNRIRILVKEAKQMVNGPYYCPNCKKEVLKILADSKNKEVLAVCTCGIEERLTFAPIFQPVDYYNKFNDIFKKKRFQKSQSNPNMSKQ